MQTGAVQGGCNSRGNYHLLIAGAGFVTSLLPVTSRCTPAEVQLLQITLRCAANTNHRIYIEPAPAEYYLSYEDLRPINLDLT